MDSVLLADQGFRIARLHGAAFLDAPALSSLLAASTELLAASAGAFRSALICLIQKRDPDLDKAVCALASARGDACSIRAVATALAAPPSDAHHTRRVSQALLKMAGKGDVVAIEAVSDCLKHESSVVREHAVITLKELSSPGDAAVLPKLVAALADEGLRVRMAAADALSKIAERGDPLWTALIVDYLGHQSLDVREAALIALHRLTAPGCADIVASISLRMEDADIGGRKALLMALQQLSPPGNQPAILEAARRLTDSSIEVRKMALRVLGALAEDLPPNLERVLESSLQDSHASVRKTAVSALEKLAAKNPWLRSRLLSRLEDPAPCVQCAAILAAGRICDLDDEASANTLAACLDSNEKMCEAAAQQSLGWLLQRGSRAPLPALARLLWHGNEKVRESANLVLSRLPPQWQWLREKWSPATPPSRPLRFPHKAPLFC